MASSAATFPSLTPRELRLHMFNSEVDCNAELLGPTDAEAPHASPVVPRHRFAFANGRYVGAAMLFMALAALLCIVGSSQRNWHRVPKGNTGFSRLILVHEHAPGQCSNPGEDCGNVGRCCGQGLQCYRKDEYYAACMAICDSSSGWTCEAVGDRNPQKTPGTWAGEDCIVTRSCNNEGLNCIKKDSSSAYCTKQAPAGWEGEILGGWRTEYQVLPAMWGAPTFGVSLFCFVAILPGSSEEGLVLAAKEHGGSVFKCSASAIYRSEPAKFVSIGTWSSFANTESFIKIWEMVRDDGKYRNYDWTVKVDPDCVFMADRLTSHLTALRVPAGKPVYIKNSNVSFGFLGAVEIINQVGMINYFESYQGCHRTMGDGVSGEDGFLKACLDALGVGYMTDASILKLPYDQAPCSDPTRVAFHPHKDVAGWLQCYNTASR